MKPAIVRIVQLVALSAGISVLCNPAARPAGAQPTDLASIRWSTPAPIMVDSDETFSLALEVTGATVAMVSGNVVACPSSVPPDQCGSTDVVTVSPSFFTGPPGTFSFAAAAIACDGPEDVYLLARVTLYDAQHNYIGFVSSPATATTVAAANEPLLALAPVELVFTSYGGLQPQAQTVSVRSACSDRLYWTATTDTPWLHLNPTTGGFPRRADSITVAVDVAALDATGSPYAGSITISSSQAANGPRTIPVRLNLSDAAALRWVTPPPATVESGQTFPLQLNVSGPGVSAIDGQFVACRANVPAEQCLGVDPTFDIDRPYFGGSPGTYHFSVNAFDCHGPEDFYIQPRVTLEDAQGNSLGFFAGPTTPVTVHSPAGSILQPSPGRLTFTALRGLNPPSQNIFLASRCGELIRWTATSNAQWLHVTGTGGTVAPLNSAQAEVEVANLDPAQGPFKAMLTFTAPGLIDPVLVPVTLDLRDATVRWSVPAPATVNSYEAFPLELDVTAPGVSTVSVNVLSCRVGFAIEQCYFDNTFRIAPATLSGPPGVFRFTATGVSCNEPTDYYFVAQVILPPETSMGPFLGPPTVTSLQGATVSDLNVGPFPLIFNAFAGIDPPPPQAISIRTVCGDRTTWTATTDVPWLRVTPASGREGQAEVSVDVTGLDPSRSPFSGTVIVDAPHSPNGPQSIPVTLTLAPTVSVRWRTSAPAMVASGQKFPLVLEVTGQAVGVVSGNVAVCRSNVPPEQCSASSQPFNVEPASFYGGPGTFPFTVTGFDCAGPEDFYVVAHMGVYDTRQSLLGNLSSPMTATTLQAPAGPLTNVYPGSLQLETFRGINPAAQQLTIQSVCGDTGAWNATTSAPWLRVTPSSGRLSPFSSPIAVTIDASNLDPAQSPFSGAVTVASPGGPPTTIAVTLVVRDDVSARWTTPAPASVENGRAFPLRLEVVGDNVARVGGTIRSCPIGSPPEQCFGGPLLDVVPGSFDGPAGTFDFTATGTGCGGPTDAYLSAQLTAFDSNGSVVASFFGPLTATTLQPPTGPLLRLTPNAFQFTAFGALAPRPQAITLASICNDGFRWTASADVPWLRISPSAQNPMSSQSQALIAADPAGLDPAQSPFIGMVTFNAPQAVNAPIKVPVMLDLRANISVRWSVPAPPAVQSGQPFPLSLEVVGPGVQRIVSGQVLACRSDVPVEQCNYSNSVRITPPTLEGTTGTFELMATAFDCAGPEDYYLVARLWFVDDAQNIYGPFLSPLTTTSIQAPPASQLAVDPSTLQFNTFGGLNPLPQTVRVQAACGGSARWTASADVPWLHVSPATGQVAGQDAVDVAVDAAGLDPTQSALSGNITFTPATGPSTTLPVTLNVHAPVTLRWSIPAPPMVASGEPFPLELEVAGSQLLSVSAQVIACRANVPMDQCSPALSAITVQPQLVNGGPGRLRFSAQGIDCEGPEDFYIAASVTLLDSFGNNVGPVLSPLTTTTLQPPLTPDLLASPLTLTFTSLGGIDPPAQMVVVASRCGDRLRWAGTANVPWLTVSPPGGSATAQSYITIAPTVAGLDRAQSPLTGTVTFTSMQDPNKHVDITTTLTLLPPATPTRTITHVPTRTKTLTPTPTPTPLRCIGDCGGNHAVTVDELIKGVNIALEIAPVAQCPQLDDDGNQHVTVDELIKGVQNALNGCP